MIQIVWEFVVREAKVVEFEQVYSPTGSWASLFRGSSGFLGTTLWRDTRTPRRYITIDRWENAASHAAIRERFAKAYDALDRDCEGFTETEHQIGAFEQA